MAKAWRKHNMKMSANCIKLAKEIPHWKPDSEPRKTLEKKLSYFTHMKLWNQSERRSHFQAEVTFPSPLLLALFMHAGLPTYNLQPSDVISQLRGAAAKPKSTGSSNPALYS